MSMQAPSLIRRSSLRRARALAIMEPSERVRIVRTFRSGIRPRTSTMNRFSSNARRYTRSRPTRSTAARIASYARTVEPCSASLRNTIDPVSPPAAEPPNRSPSLRTAVSTAHAGTPARRSIRCSVRARALNRGPGVGFILRCSYRLRWENPSHLCRAGARLPSQKYMAPLCPAGVKPYGPA